MRPQSRRQRLITQLQALHPNPPAKSIQTEPTPHRFESHPGAYSLSWGGAVIRRMSALQALERSPSELNRGRDSRIGFDLLEDSRRGKEAAGMALSDDLRERVVGAVVEGGMSRNAAAKRFGVSIASAVRWVARFKAKGVISPSR